jgi:DNA adenine methylase
MDMNSPFPWPGGKRALQKTLLSLIPEHEIYAEVFAGSAKLLFAKKPAPHEVLNDLNGEIINFFRVAKHRPAELAERLQLECIHAERFRELRIRIASEDEIDRALRFAYLVWYSFGAKGQHFASFTARSPKVRRPLDRVRDLLQGTAERLSAVLIEQRDFAEIIDRYDSEKTFFYLDPPYVSYQPNGRYQPLTKERREELFAQLSKIKGLFLMSFDNCAEIRSLVRKHCFKTRRQNVVYTIGRNATRKASPELLISNYAVTDSTIFPSI